jgi:phosphonate transport system permease protein
MQAAAPYSRDPAWHGRVTAAIVCMALLWPALVFSEFKPWLLFDSQSLTAAGRFAAAFLTPSFEADFLAMVLRETWQTVAIATAGLSLALLGAIPAAILITEKLSVSRMGTGRMRLPAKLLRQLVRWILVLLRSVPELVWAALMVLAAGLGPFAGALALGLHTTGVLGRLFAETLENAPREPEQALLNGGSGAIAAFAYGTLPGVFAQAVAYSLYRWEMNIRMAAVLGFVGAGGLGQMLYFHLSLFQHAQASTVLLAMVVLVVAVDGSSGHWRRGLAPAYA